MASRGVPRVGWTDVTKWGSAGARKRGAGARAMLFPILSHAAESVLRSTYVRAYEVSRRPRTGKIAGRDREYNGGYTLLWKTASINL